MIAQFKTFARAEAGAVTVDWTVLSAAAVSMALATTALMNSNISFLEGRMDDELRSRQLSDDWIDFYASHFEPVLQTGYISEDQASELFEEMNGAMNHSIVTRLEEGIAAIDAGTIEPDDLVQLIAIASVAYQRNIVSDAVLNEYFGFDGSTPAYMDVANPPASNG